MITLNTNCDACIHENVCKYKDNAKFAMERLRGMQYGKGPNDDYDWDTIMKHKRVDIAFSCPDFKNKMFRPNKFCADLNTR